MFSAISFPSHLPSPSNHLKLTLISLEDWALITLNGPDSVKYLHSQLTCDVALLDIDRFRFAAHCNAEGKMLSYLCIFHHREGIAFIERRSVRDSQLAELKKYAVFSRTTIIADDEAVLLGLAGFQAKATLERFFAKVPDADHPVMHYQKTTLLYFNSPTPRFVLVTTQAVRNAVQHKLQGQAQLNDSRQWLALDIEACYPIIDSANSKQFIPQAANIQALSGIDFNKGCYTGQEIIARAKYRGANKRAMYWLVGKAGHLPNTGDYLELKMGNLWRPTGTVLAACQLADGSVWIQAVISKDLASNSMLRVCDDDAGELTIHPLPYIIN
ncbi:tRNA-modifying protein YgfZ [Sodalis endosymbiont of Henestaris halophilus]|uniref:tRNA-modifying protein YgfZ n=1 Tax=Sodalis endosymbiont of Henestaris halophilus TaxID=1929246 RepID=UPI000BC007B0|nr:tRNA-modifying protein YgfZ [Sodalis endosymbiont of Henestaris halophilus]SNC58637.1 tRNA-modifying protein YgfZ [Sodalis endosymbiont of Henestaris halophilus]